jgi:hypothetical protein
MEGVLQGGTHLTHEGKHTRGFKRLEILTRDSSPGHLTMITLPHPQKSLSTKTPDPTPDSVWNNTYRICLEWTPARPTARSP